MALTATETQIVRRMNPWERLPEALRLNYPQINPEWCWVLDGERGIEAVCYGADMHGIAQIMMIKTLEGTARHSLLLLLRGVVADLRERGYTMLMTWLSATRPAELKLARVFQRLGGKLVAESGYFAVATLRERRW